MQPGAIKGLVLAMALSTGGAVQAQEQNDDDLARATQNPVADLISLPLQNNSNFNWGPDDEVQNVLNIQPVWPINATEDWNVITRTILPVISQPSVAPGEDRKNGLGDTSFSAFLSPSQPGKVIWGVGPVVLLPTATSDRLGSDKWGLGPSAVLITMQGPWVAGSLFSNVWSVAGSGDDDINLFTWQPFINYNLPDSWYLTTAPLITANWEASSSDRWTVPLGGGFGKVFRIGSQPLNAQVQGFYNAAKPDLGADWTLRLQLQFLFPK